MKHIAVVLEIAALMLLAAALYVFAPTLRSRFAHVTGAPAAEQAANPMPAVPSAPRPKPAPLIKRVAKSSPEPKVAPEIEASQSPIATMGFLDPSANGRFKEIFKVVPGGRLHLDNDQYDWVKMRSSFPVAFKFGNCGSPNTVDIECNSAPGEITITDNRTSAHASTDPANSVEVIARDSNAPKFPPKSFTIRAGGTLRITNSVCRDVKVHSDHALTVSMGTCSDIAAYDFECNSEVPTDIFLTDHRNRDEAPMPVIVTCADKLGK